MNMRKGANGGRHHIVFRMRKHATELMHTNSVDDVDVDVECNGGHGGV